MFRRPLPFHLRKPPFPHINKLLKSSRLRPYPRLLLHLLLTTTALILIIPHLNILPSPYSPYYSKRPYQSNPRAVQLAKIAVDDQLQDQTSRLPSHLFLNDTDNEAILIQKAHIPPVFATRLGPYGRRHLLQKLTLDSNGIPIFEAMPRLLIIDLQNGLGNRLRALGSALEFAFNTRRILVILWAADPHINATMSHIFHPSLLRNLVVIDQPVAWPINPNDIHPALKAPGQTKIGNNAFTRSVSLMSKDVKYRDSSSFIRDYRGMHLYVRTAYVLSSRVTRGNLVNAFIQALTPNEAVTKMVEDIEEASGGPEALASMVGVHIRSRSIVEDNDAVDHECEYSVDGAALTDKWRGMSTPVQFIPQMHRIRSEWSRVVRESYGMVAKPRWSAEANIARANSDAAGRGGVVAVDVSVKPKFYVSADSVSTLEVLRNEFGREEIAYLKRDCDDRGMECILCAYADLIVLSRTGAMLASGWSSFSEAAARLRVRPFGMEPSRTDGYVIRTSGIDFGGPTRWEQWKERMGKRVWGVLMKTGVRSKVSQADRIKLCEERRRNSTAAGKFG
eukprot:GFKZ01010039.1.p1 GENE.GFKZ01010039.1~~GFKZ01010039.1.p1  ORF type:complete len:593 (-),score=57.62 GFKZ01010039.1:121-1809(-)